MTVAFSFSLLSSWQKCWHPCRSPSQRALEAAEAEHYSFASFAASSTSLRCPNEHKSPGLLLLEVQEPTAYQVSPFFFIFKRIFFGPQLTVSLIADHLLELKTTTPTKENTKVQHKLTKQSESEWSLLPNHHTFHLRRSAFLKWSVVSNAF